MWAMFSSSGQKSSLPERSLKEELLNLQISKLKQIYDDACLILQKSISTLKSVTYVSNDSTTKTHSFNLQEIEDMLAALFQYSSLDKDRYVQVADFRQHDKKTETQFFKQTMQNYEHIKNNLNEHILELEGSIQKLEIAGFHIYERNPKPNNILNTLKKPALDKYITIQSELTKITNKLLSRRKNSTVFPCLSAPNKKKLMFLKLKAIMLKEYATKRLLIDKITLERSKIHSQKVKKDPLIKGIQILKSQIKLVSFECKELKSKELKDYSRRLKQKYSSSQDTSLRFRQPTLNRSKSCHIIIQTKSIFAKSNRDTSKKSIDISKLYRNLFTDLKSQ